MPQISYPGEQQPNLGASAALNENPDQAQDPYNPTLWETVGAQFRHSNTIVSALSDKMHGVDWTQREDGLTGDAVWNQIKGTKYEPYWDRFAHVFNSPAIAALKSQIDMEQDDNKTIAASGWTGTAIGFGASILDWPTLIPGGTLVRNGRLGLDVVRSALLTGTAAALGTGAQEFALQQTQQTRPMSESAMAVGGGFFFGSLLGGGAASLLSAAERRAAGATFEKASPLLNQVDENLDGFRAGSLGAAAAPGTTDTLQDLSIAGKSAAAVGKSTAKLNPTLRAAHSPSIEHRATMADLQETGFYLNKNMEGEGNIAVETAMKYWERGALGNAITDTRALFSAGRKAGMDMTRTEFSEAVGRAMRRGDQGENEWVTQAAQAWRSKLFDPLKHEAISARLLDENVAPKTASSYLSRVYKTGLIEAEESQFKGIVSRWVAGQLDAAQEAARRAAARGEKADTLTPAFVSEADKQDYIEGIAKNVFDTLTGRANAGEPSYRLTMAKRGPLAERTFNIPDTLIERYLESDVEMIGRRYARIMSADVELAKKFDGDPTMKARIDKVRADYAKLRDEARAAGKPEKEISRLAAREKRDINDIESVRDLIRGQYKVQNQHTPIARVLSAAQTFNYLRTMGGVLVGNLNDAYRPIMRNGLVRYMSEAAIPLITNLRAIKMSARDARLMGAVTERLLMSRLATLTDLADPYATRGPFERMLNNISTTFSKLTLLPWFNDFNKSVSAVLTQNRILRNAGTDFASLGSRDHAYMGFVGINADMAARIDKMFKEFGDVDGNVHIANFEQWTDDQAKQAFAAAVNKDTDTSIITRGHGDIPLVMNTPAGKALGQFKSFALASNQRMLMLGLQEGPGSIMSGLIGMSAIGVMQYWLRQVETGREIETDPGRLVAEGVDRSGILSVPFEINNIWEKLQGDGFYSLATSLSGGKHETASRYQSRNAADALAGPTLGLAQDLASLIAIAGRAETSARGAPNVDILSPADIDTMRRLAPFASLPMIRWLVDRTIVPAAKEAVR